MSAKILQRTSDPSILGAALHYYDLGFCVIPVNARKEPALRSWKGYQTKRPDRAELRHLFDQPFVEYIGEVDEAGKADLLGGAVAMLFPIDWREPFGLVMIEAMACGTPVVAWRGGSVAEIITDGVTGFVVDDLDDAVEATTRAAALDRRRCREMFEERFTADRMARDYVGIYEVLTRRRPDASATGAARTPQEV